MHLEDGLTRSMIESVVDHQRPRLRVGNPLARLLEGHSKALLPGGRLEGDDSTFRPDVHRLLAHRNPRPDWLLGRPLDISLECPGSDEPIARVSPGFVA